MDSPLFIVDELEKYLLVRELADIALIHVRNLRVLHRTEFVSSIKACTTMYSVHLGGVVAFACFDQNFRPAN